MGNARFADMNISDEGNVSKISPIDFAIFSLSNLDLYDTDKNKYTTSESNTNATKTDAGLPLERNDTKSFPLLQLLLKICLVIYIRESKTIV